ncbi:MAG: DUF4255 domain-containing protein [Candidatus Brocadiales bacterium]|nr:DUF4255 domain-containing protein [Candidatus Brocadiales bacterium]
MSNYNVINAVGKTLKELIWSAMQYDSTIFGIIGSEQQISFEPPFKLVKDGDPDKNYISLYLYRVVENGEMKNRPLEPKDANLLQYPPLSLNLFYLITPLTNSAENGHKLLGKTMQIFYDNAIVKGPALQDILANTAEELRIILNPISMEDIMKLWSAFMRPYRLSLSYEVKVVYIDSERETEAELVRRKKIEFMQISGV